MSVITRVVNRFTYPAEKPLVAVTLYYGLVLSVGALVLWLAPELRPLVSGERLAMMGKGQNPFTDPATGAVGGAWLSWQFTLLLGVAMLGAFILMVPTSWVYMATRRKRGFDQAVVQTMLILALSVAGVVVIVRNSLALAFSLAGIVGAVRFRNSLPDTRDTLYVFLSIGVGLAAGVEALAGAAVLSMIFNYTLLLMWRADYGMCDLAAPAGHLLLSPVPAPHSNGSDPATNGKRPGKKKAADYNAVLLVRTRTPTAGRSAVEEFLGRQTKRWHLAEAESVKSGETVHKYLIRLGKRAEPSDVEDALLDLGSPDVIGARIH